MFLKQDKNRLEWSVEWEGLSHRGRVRSSNEDFMGVYQTGVQNGCSLFVVADGMGGHAAGEVASRTAVESITREFKNLSQMQDDDRLVTSIQNANKSIYHLARANSSYRGMGTTCVAMLLRNDRAAIAHVGDSRAYLIRSGKIHQITRDHSPVWEMQEKGMITKEQARVHTARNILSRNLGAEAEVNVELDHPSIHLEDNDSFLLCTDGLNTKLKDSEILHIVLAHSSLSEACRKLVRRANEKGGEDNTTVQLINAKRTTQTRIPPQER